MQAGGEQDILARGLTQKTRVLVHGWAEISHLTPIDHPAAQLPCDLQAAPSQLPTLQLLKSYNTLELSQLRQHASVLVSPFHSFSICKGEDVGLETTQLHKYVRGAVTKAGDGRTGW